MAHREGIRAYLKNVEVHGLVYDWGCGTKPIENHLKQNNAKFITLDQLEHVKPVKVVDFEQPQPVYDEADFAFCIEVLEHVWNSKILLTSIFSNLKKGGVLYLSQPFFYEVHKEDDRVRYTWRGLLKLLHETGFLVDEIVPTVGSLDKAEGYVLKATKV